MTLIVRFLTSTIGRKVLMALTGLLLFAFLIAHLSANLLVFRSAESFNHYSHSLVSNPLIYLAEAGLAVLFVAHLASGILLTLKNRSARGVGYQFKRRAGHASHKSVASTTMILTGLVVLIFVPLHIVTFKFGKHYDSAADPAVRDLFRLVMEVFQSPLYVAWYIVALLIIGFHLWHGFGSAFESLGVRYRIELRRVGQVLAVLIAGGFILIPIVVYFTGGQL